MVVPLLPAVSGFWLGLSALHSSLWPGVLGSRLSSSGFVAPSPLARGWWWCPGRRESRRDLGGAASPPGSGLPRGALVATCRLCVHLACCLRFLEERRAITEKLAAEQDAFLREAQKQHAHELRLLQEGHQRHILSLTAELETRRQAEVDALRSSFERERWALAEAREAESQVKHVAEVSVLEARHASHLDALRLQYLSELQAVQGRHRRALELLRLDLEERLQKEDVAHHGVLTQVLELLELRCAQEPQSAEDSLRGDGSVEPPEGVRALWLHGARKVRCVDGAGTGTLPFPRTRSCQLHACLVPLPSARCPPPAMGFLVRQVQNSGFYGIFWSQLLGEGFWQPVSRCGLSCELAVGSLCSLGLVLFL